MEVDVEKLLQEAEQTTGIIVEAAFTTEVESFNIALDNELTAFVNRAVLSQADKISHSFDEPLTQTFALNIDRLVKRLQFMTGRQRSELYSLIEVNIKKYVYNRLSGRNEKESNQLASHLTSHIVVELKSRIEGGTAHLTSKEV